MRGKLGGAHMAEAGRRITPAHAGKTLRGQGAYLFAQDHPRACGEN